MKKAQNQPKKHIGKTKALVAARRKKIVKAIVAGKTQKQAGIEAGLSEKTAEGQVCEILKEPEVKKTFRDLLDKTIPDEVQAEKYKEILNATKVISANIINPQGDGMADAHSMTKDFIDVPDYPTQLRANDSISRLKGYLDEKNIPIGPVNIMIVYDEIS